MSRHFVPIVAALLLLSTSLPAAAALVSRWGFDEAGGTTAFDLISGFDGTLEGSASFAAGAGIRGGAIQLSSGTNDLVNMGDHLEFTGIDSFSIQAWIKTTQTSGSLLVGRHVATVVAGYWLGLNDTGDGPPNEDVGSFHLYQSDQPILNSGDQNLDDDQWHQIVAVRDQDANHIRLYVDGRRVPAETSTDSLNPINSTPAPFLVGGLVIDSTRTGSFTGLMDEVRVWNSPLSDFEVAYFFDHPDSIQAVLCGDANLSDTLTAGDALVVLKTAVGSSKCDACICDANDSESITASDALLVLKKAVGQEVTLDCPGCAIPN